MRQSKPKRTLLRPELVVAVLLLGLTMATANRVVAQSAPSAPELTSSRIKSESLPYSIRWDGKTGVFHRDALGTEPEQNLPLVFLHTDPGPKGYAKYLAWFLVRDANSFSILWCYLNESGSEFWCWLYRFPGNQLTTNRFVGDYRFVPPAEPVGPTPAVFSPSDTPRYLGPDFAFGNWTRRSGTVANLALRPVRGYSEPLAAAERVTNPSEQKDRSFDSTGVAAVRNLTNLQATPLHQIQVSSANGWRQNGWNELHALLVDGANDPYYGILYSNSTRGYLVDLKHAQIYVADFGKNVSFAKPSAVYGGPSRMSDEPETLRIRRYERYEFDFTTEQKAANPYADSFLEADFKSPNGKTLLVAGYWDGGDNWHVRFVPTMLGEWKWRLRSSDPGLNDRTGVLECAASPEHRSGFLQVEGSYTYRDGFETSDGKPFYPAFLRESVLNEADKTVLATNGSERIGPDAEGGKLPASFMAFAKRVDKSVELGINRFVGGFLLDASGAPAVNEGGPAFEGADSDRLNPQFFQWLDRRIAYCNEKGIVPDIGLAESDFVLTQPKTAARLGRMLQYLAARYNAFNVCWNLFGAQDAPKENAATVTALGKLANKYDPYGHPLTTTYAGAMNVPAWRDPSMDIGDRRTKRAGLTAAEIPAPPAHAKEKWLDVLTQLGGDLNSLDWNRQFNKPLVIEEFPRRYAVAAAVQGMNPDIARQRMWMARMHNGYWIGQSTAADAVSSAAPDALRYAVACSRFFQQTHFWRLESHPEVIGEPDAKGHRKKPSDAAPAIAADVAPMTGSGLPDAPAVAAAALPALASAFVLSDLAWEYVVYMPNGGTVSLDLLEATGRIRATWFNPRSGKYGITETVKGGDYQKFTAPDSGDWVLYLDRR